MKKESSKSLVEGFQHHHRRDPKPVTPSTEVTQLRPVQVECFKCLRFEPLGILNSPTGSGKSVVTTAILGDRLLRDPLRKVLITAPQQIISRNFVRRRLIQIPDGPLLEWWVGEDLSGESRSKMKRLREFLLSPPGRTFPERIAVANQACLTRMWRELDANQRSRAFLNTTLLIDEAHHIQSSEEDNNQLGGLVAHVLDADVNAEILLSTAFFFRGDRAPIISNRHLEKFVRHHVPFDQHWESLAYLESYSYDFVAYKGSPWKELEALLSRSQEPTIFYCPPEGHPMLGGRPKAEFIARLTDLICRHYRGIRKWTPETTPDEDGPFLLDLSQQPCRDPKIDCVVTRGEQVAVIIAVGMFKEGADWLQAARVIDFVPSGSDQDRNQRFGRLMRDHPGKRHVHYYSFLQHVSDRPRESQRQHLTELFAHFVASLVLENALAPIRVPVPTGATSPHVCAKVEYLNLLGDLSQQQQEQILRDCSESLIELMSKAEPPTSDEAKNLIMDVMRLHGVTKHFEARATQFWLMLRRRSVKRVQAADLVEAGFDKVFCLEDLKCLTLFSSGVGGPKTFREIRTAIQTVFEQSWHENYERVRQLAALPEPCDRAYWWCQHNRVLRKEGKLDSGRTQLLEEIDWWTWSISRDDRWDENYEAIQRLSRQPKSGTQNYEFVRTQRRLYDEGTLSEEKIHSLEQIAWWRWANNRRNWESEYGRIAKLTETPKPGTTEYEWVKYQRQRYRKGQLPDDRIQKLEQIEWWSWNTASEDKWLQTFERVAGLAQPPGSYEPEYQWVRKQKDRYRAGRLEAWKVKLLETIAWWRWE